MWNETELYGQLSEWLGLYSTINNRSGVETEVHDPIGVGIRLSSMIRSRIGCRFPNGIFVDAVDIVCLVRNVRNKWWTMTMTQSEKSHIRQMKAWPYRQECRGHDPTKKESVLLVKLAHWQGVQVQTVKDRVQCIKS